MHLHLKTRCAQEGAKGSLSALLASHSAGLLSEKYMVVTAHWCCVAKLVYFWVWELQQDTA